MDILATKKMVVRKRTKLAMKALDLGRKQCRYEANNAPGCCAHGMEIAPGRVLYVG